MSSMNLQMANIGANLFSQRVTSRPTTATVYVERPTKDPLAVRLEESLKRAAELQRNQSVKSAIEQSSLDLLLPTT